MTVRQEKKVGCVCCCFFSFPQKVVDAILAASFVLDDEGEMTAGDKTIYFMTGAYSECKRLSDLDALVNIFNEKEIGFNLLGANFWESETERDKRAAVPLAKKNNEAALRGLVESVNGRYYSLSEGCKLLSAFRSKPVAQRPTYTGTLTLGDMSVSVRMFLHAKQNPLPTLKKLSAYSQLLTQQDAVEGGGRSKTKRDEEEEAEDELRASMEVKMERDYIGVIEPDKHYVRSELVRGYRFGKSIVPFSTDDLVNLKYKVRESFRFFFF
jgi:ATP-dependent DNA helicase 2 subunit 2